MATQVQFRRGTTTQNNAFTGALAEITYDTEVKTLRLHDGTTAGGGAIVTTNAGTQTLTNKTISTNSIWQGNAIGLASGGTNASLTAVAGGIAYSGASALAISAPGTSGQLLTSSGSSAPTWTSQSALSVGTANIATTATNIAGGSAGQIVIQLDTNQTTFISAGPAGTFLQSTGASTPPTFAAGEITIGSTSTPLGGTSTSLDGLDILTATGTSHWKLPAGTVAQRPASPSNGMVRYNTEQSSFEGYASGAWSSLGGVKSVNALTFIQAETGPGVGNGELEFYVEDTSQETDTVKAGGWTKTGLTITNSLGVGTASSGTAGEIRATNQIVAFFSDKRLKENIKPIENAVDKIKQISGVTYTPNALAESFGYVNKDEQVGVIAQEVEQVLPQVVKSAPFDTMFVEGVEISRSGQHYKTVQYEKLVPLLVQAIKEQQIMIEELQNKIGK
jgi:hypothetical protein